MDGGEVGIEVPLVALAYMMTRWAVGGIWSHLFVSFSTFLCAATMGQSGSEFCNFVATSLKNPVIPVWSCGAVFAGVCMLFLGHQRNHMRAHFSTRRDNGEVMTRGDFTVKA